MIFYAQDELNALYQAMKKKPYKEKETWEKYLNDSYSVYCKKQKKIKQHELSIDYIEALSR